MPTDLHPHSVNINQIIRLNIRDYLGNVRKSVVPYDNYHTALGKSTQTKLLPTEKGIKKGQKGKKKEKKGPNRGRSQLYNPRTF